MGISRHISNGAIGNENDEVELKQFPSRMKKGFKRLE